ncbi:MAG: ATP-binding cassette domain-containing protein [Clostridia bacterium]|nr:ATP-binding cassette domain-containing protein [Clostridia bacterium]
MKLELRNISKSYGKTKALIDFTATLEPGIYALLGPNGSGKSTLMNIITDNLKMDKGEIIFDGENAKTMGVRFREKIGFMPQYPGIYPSFTVEDYLWYMAKLKGMTNEAARKGIPEVLAAVELTESLKTKVGALSGGMKQRLCLASAVLGDPDILILDEPTAGLDPKQRIAVRNYISQISFNKIVIIATHVVSDIEYIAGNIIILKKGEIHRATPPAALLAEIEGKVWLAEISENELETLQKTSRVTNISKEDACVRVRILAETAPHPSAKNTAPTLEDYYLYVFGETQKNTVL